MLIAGVLFFILSGILYYFKNLSSKKLIALHLTDTYTVSKLFEIYKSVASEMGRGFFKMLVEVTGKIECPNPIIGELSKIPCLYCESYVDMEIEESFYVPNPKTNQSTLRTIRRSERVSSLIRHAEFFLWDETGKIKIDPHQAEIDKIKVVDYFQPANGYSKGMSGFFNFGGFFPSRFSHFGRPGKIILGYKYTEFIFPLDKKVFIIGEANDKNGILQISKPSSNEGVFIISNKSEEELVNEIKSSIWWLQFGNILFLILGIIMVIAEIFVNYVK